MTFYGGLRITRCRIVGILASFCVISGLFSGPSEADPGVGITLSKIEVNDGLKAGSRVDLPAIGVFNTGTSRQDYEMVVSTRGSQAELRPNPNWIEANPPRFSLAPGQSQQVELHLTVPAGASVGQYLALIEAQVDDPGQPIQAGVAAKLTFAIVETSWYEARKRQLDGWLDDAQPWTTIVPIALLVAIAFRWSSRRVRFRLPFEPR